MNAPERLIPDVIPTDAPRVLTAREEATVNAMLAELRDGGPLSTWWVTTFSDDEAKLWPAVAAGLARTVFPSGLPRTTEIVYGQILLTDRGRRYLSQRSSP